MRAAVLGLGALVAAAAVLPAQSLLDRPPNLSGGWVANPGTVQFNFLHRFVRSDAPERKITNFPTFLVAVGLPRRVMLGFNYATNSTLAPRYPNEWEFFGRYAPFEQDAGAPLDVAAQLSYNLAAEGGDGEVSLARRVGPVRLIGVTRVLSNPFVAGETRLVLGGGAVVRLGRYVALAGDLASLTRRDSARDERVAWSAGLQLAIPNTPHTLSFQVANTNTATLQGVSRGGAGRRYGFEFTIPITLARYFGRQQPPPASPPAPAAAAPAAPAPSPGAAATSVVQTGIRSMAFARTRIEIPVGTAVEWKNNDPLGHTVTALDRSFDSGLIAPGGTWRRTFDRPGTYEYVCTPHPFMKGVVVVRGAP
jgi:plastocyanin